MDLKYLHESTRDPRYRIAALIRKKVEKYAEQHEIDDDLGGLCGLASRVLCDAFRKAGYKAHAVTGRFNGEDYHCWVTSGGLRFDITATQFHYYDEDGDRDYPKVYITSNNGPMGSMKRGSYGGSSRGLETDDIWPEEAMNPSVKNARRIHPYLYPPKRSKRGRFSR